MENGFACIWEFEVAPGCEEAFLRHYAPGGTWVQLFRADPAYIETVLLKDPARPARYLTIDRWRSAQAYLTFRQRHAVQYGAIDEMCESLTTSERDLGAYQDIGAAG